MTRCGLLLLNLGTPDSPSVGDVRRYLREFLMDARVIDINVVRRALLLNLFILPFRPKKTAEAYRKIWTDGGSPLLAHGQDLQTKLAERLGADVTVELAMRYREPSIRSALSRFAAAGVDRIALLPLFPQYSSAASGSGIEKVFVEATRLWNVPAIQVVPPFYDHPGFIDAFVSVARPVLDDLEPDAVLMSFHGLPERHLFKGDTGQVCLKSGDCCDRVGPTNRFCYRAHCFATARALARELGLSEADYRVTFQSRLGLTKWITPYTDEVVVKLAKQGVKRLAVLSPAFVADCLETVEEIGIRAKESFETHGGTELRLVPSLNATDVWVDGVLRIIRDAAALCDVRSTADDRASPVA